MPNKKDFTAMKNHNQKNQFNSCFLGFNEVVEHKKSMIESGFDLNKTNNLIKEKVKQNHPENLSLRVSHIIQNTHSTKTFRFVSTTGKLPTFQAGQYISLKVNIDGFKTARPYTISSPPHAYYYDLTIKKNDNGYISKYFHEHVKVGDILHSSSPMGNFYYNPLFHGKCINFIAAGAGITPAMSMIKALINVPLTRFNLIYVSRNTEDIIFEKELKSLEKKHEFLTISTILTQPKNSYQGHSGHLTPELLSKLININDKEMFYVCGPDSFKRLCHEQLVNLGIKSRKIKYEYTNIQQHSHHMPPLSKTEKVTITINGADNFETNQTQSILESLERNGYTMKNGCRSGDCSLCRVKVIKGTVASVSNSNLRETDTQYGWCHSCVAFPTENIEIIT